MKVAKPLSIVSSLFPLRPSVFCYRPGGCLYILRTVVGVLDTGVWPEHPSYSDPDPAGEPYAAPPPASDNSRACEFAGGGNPGPAFTCNNKLIGADRFMATYDALIPLLPERRRGPASAGPLLFRPVDRLHCRYTKSRPLAFSTIRSPSLSIHFDDGPVRVTASTSSTVR